MPEVKDPALLAKLNGGVPGRPIGGVDPTLRPKTIKANNEATASNYAPADAAANLRIKELEARIKEIEANNAGPQATIELEKARLELKKLQTEIESVKTGKGTALDALQSQVDRVNRLYSDQLKGGAPNGLNLAIPDMFQPNVSAFDSAAQGLVNPFMSAFRVPGSGSQSDTELRQFLQANTPAQGDPDQVIEEKLRNIQTRIDAERGPKAQSAPVQGDPLAQATGDTRTEVDEFRKGVMSRVSQMVTEGKPRSQVEKFIRENGMNPNAQNLGELYRFRNSGDFNRWQRQNPGAILPLDPQYYTREVPMSQLRQNFNRAAATDLGGAAASYAASAANGLSGNRLDGLAENLGGNPEEVNTGLALLRQNHPAASTLGDASGQVMFDMMASRVPGLRGLAGTKLGQLGMDVGYGAYTGQGEGNTLGGIASNVAGGVAGRGVARLGGKAIGGVKNASAQYLNEAGVPLTIGQIARGSDSVLGKGLAWTEDRLAGIPVFDAIINSARRRGEVGFNKAAFNEAGVPGLTGAAGVDELGKKVDTAYSFLDGTNLPVDAPFAGSQAAVRAELPSLPEFGEQIGKGLDRIDRLGPDIPGRDWQSALRSTKANRASISGQPFSDDAHRVLGDVQDNLLTLAERQGPPGTVDNLTAANKLNGQYQTILSALDNGAAQRRGELFFAGRLDDASRQGARNFGGRAQSMKGNRPFYELSKAGMDVMPNQVPDSGTAGRSLFYAALPSIIGGGAGGIYGGLSDNMTAGEGAATGAGIGLGSTVLPTALLSALYSKPGQAVVQKALLGNRGKVANKAADVIGGQYFQNKLGPVASALLRQISLYDQLPGQ